MNAETLDKFSQTVAKLSDASPRGVPISKAADVAGLEKEQALEMAEFMRDKGWAVLNFQDVHTIRLTAKGHEEIKSR